MTASRVDALQASAFLWHNIFLLLLHCSAIWCSRTFCGPLESRLEEAREKRIGRRASEPEVNVGSLRSFFVSCGYSITAGHSPVVDGELD